MNRHPVWEVYDQHRTARLNRKYYAARVGALRRRNFWVELVLALSTSSAVGGLWVVEDFLGGFLWKAIGTLAAILAVYKSVAKSTEKLRELESRATAYRGVEFDFERLVRDIRRRREYDESLQAEFDAVMEKLRRIAESYIDSSIDEVLRHRLYSDIRTELPAESYFVPPTKDLTGTRRAHLVSTSDEEIAAAPEAGRGDDLEAEEDLDDETGYEGFVDPVEPW